jgi:hypothetical protein
MEVTEVTGLPDSTRGVDRSGLKFAKVLGIAAIVTSSKWFALHLFYWDQMTLSTAVLLTPSEK